MRCVAPLCGCSVAGHFPACLFISYLKQPQPCTAALASSFFGTLAMRGAHQKPSILSKYTAVYARFLVRWLRCSSFRLVRGLYANGLALFSFLYERTAPATSACAQRTRTRAPFAFAVGMHYPWRLWSLPSSVPRNKSVFAFWRCVWFKEGLVSGGAHAYVYCRAATSGSRYHRVRRGRGLYRASVPPSDYLECQHQ